MKQGPSGSAVSRDGTDHSSVERRIEVVLRQLDAGRVELHFDGTTETCNILPVEANRPADDGNGYLSRTGRGKA